MRGIWKSCIPERELKVHDRAHAAKQFQGRDFVSLSAMQGTTSDTTMSSWRIRASKSPACSSAIHRLLKPYMYKPVMIYRVRHYKSVYCLYLIVILEQCSTPMTAARFQFLSVS